MSIEHYHDDYDDDDDIDDDDHDHDHHDHGCVDDDLDDKCESLVSK